MGYIISLSFLRLRKFDEGFDELLSFDNTGEVKILINSSNFLALLPKLIMEL